MPLGHHKVIPQVIVWALAALAVIVGFWIGGGVEVIQNLLKLGR